ncbi:MAG: hypothetical protein L0Y58_20105 [Verrucomicrobia subdivision 3 bacterium]|nr:hypothetical protein [Limisphaerales bacterium]
MSTVYRFNALVGVLLVAASIAKAASSLLAVIDGTALSIPATIWQTTVVSVELCVGCLLLIPSKQVLAGGL